MGGVIFPPLPAFYNQPASIDEMVDHTVARVLDLFALGPALSPACCLDGRRRPHSSRGADQG